MPGEWLAQLPEDLRGNEAFTSHATIGDFAKAHLDKVSELDGKVKESDGRVADLTKRLENAVTIPGDSATDEERKTFYSKLGVPEKPEDYELDQADIEAEADRMFRQVMLNSRIPKREAKGIHKAFVDMITQGKAAQAKAQADRETAEKAALDQAVNSLKDTWKGDVYKVNSELAKRAYKAFAKEAGFTDADMEAFETIKIGENLCLGDSPLMLRIFHAISTKISDDQMGGDRGGGGGAKSDEDKARARFPNTKW